MEKSHFGYPRDYDYRDHDYRDFDCRVLDINLYFYICVFLIKFFLYFCISEDDNLLSGSRSQWDLPTGRDLLTGPLAGLEIFAINDRYGAELQRRDTSFNASNDASKLFWIF